MVYTPARQLQEHFKLSDDQVRKIRTIVQDGANEIQKAASFPIRLDTKGKPNEDAIGKYVESPEF